METDSDVWVFRGDKIGWIWQRFSPDHELLDQSRTHFPDMDKCMEDASAHGYVRSAQQTDPPPEQHDIRTSGQLRSNMARRVPITGESCRPKDKGKAGRMKRDKV